MSSNYIIPNLALFQTLDEFINPDKKKIPVNWSFTRKQNTDIPFEWKDLLQAKRAFIIGEPGCGKSTSLKEIVIQASENGKQGIIFPINQIPNKTSIEEYLVEVKRLGDLEEKNLFEEPAFKSDNFKWEDSNNIIVCLDALDEVNANDFNEVIQKLNEFSEAYVNISILISCRKHYITSSQNKFRQFTDYAYVEVKNFTEYQIKEFLEGKYSGDNRDEIIDSIIQKSRNNADYSILTIPRYLEVLASILQDSEKKPADILKMKRVDFFEQFIYKKLEAEVKKENERKKEENEVILANEVIITKRVLEKLALVMEIYQTTQITKEELVTFLDDTNSNANLLFLNQIDLDTFINRVLKHFGDSIQFDNTEFQEYLAAKELLRMGQRSQILFDLIVEPNLKHIYNNWYDVLRYVIELEANQVLGLVNFLKQKSNGLVANDFFKLIATVDEEELDIDGRNKIFEILFNYFQIHGINISEYAERLCDFYADSSCQLSKTSIDIETKEEAELFWNEIEIVRYLIIRELLKENKYTLWKERLKKEALNSKFDFIKKQCLYSLRAFGDISIFQDIKSGFINKERAFEEAFLYSCSDVNPNCEFTIKLFIKDLLNHQRKSKPWFNYVTEPNWLTYTLNKLISNKALLELWVDERYSLGYTDSTVFLNNIEDVFNSDLLKRTKKLISVIVKNKDIETYNSEKIIGRLIVLVSKVDKDYIFKFLKVLPLDYYLYNFDKILSQIIKPRQIPKLFIALDKFDRNKFLLRKTLSTIKYSDNPEKDKIYEKGRPFFPEEYLVWERQKTYGQIEIKKQEEIFKNFLEELNVPPGYVNYDVFSTFYNNKDIIYKKTSKVQIRKLKILLKEQFINNDIGRYFELNITNKENNSTSYTITNAFIHNYGFYLKVALELGMDKEVAHFRRYFVQYLPIAGNKIEAVLNYLGEFTEDDIQNLFTIISNRNDDFILYSPRSFIQAVRKTKREEFIPFVREYIYNPQVSHFEKAEAIECLGEVFPDRSSLNKLFSDFLTVNIELAEVANQYLIVSFKDEAAIEWRFDEVKRRCKPFIKVYKSGTRLYPAWEQEIDKPKFLSHIINLNDPKLNLKFKELLLLSFEIRHNEEFIEYSNYLQKNVYSYFSNLKNYGSYSFLKDLKNYINTILNYNTKSFRGLLRNLEIEYVDLLARPNNFADCVKRYNEIKGKRYQPILSSLELYHIIQDVIDEDIITFIQKEGFYRPTEYFSGGKSRAAKVTTSGRKAYAYVNEDAIQKTIKIQIENGLLKRGFRDVDIHREVQLYDDKRLDLLISYGFVGPIMIELKLLHNPEILLPQKRAQYKNKIKQYLAGSYSEYGIYLVFKVKNNAAHDAAFKDLQKEYKDIEALDVKKIDCCSL